MSLISSALSGIVTMEIVKTTILNEEGEMKNSRDINFKI